jgi:membrane associated rhomboid family serine protease
VEVVLDWVASAAPDPWYPRLYAERSGVDPNALGEVLEMAWLEKLVERADGRADLGAGFVLTELGERVRRDPELLRRLRDGLPLIEGDPGALVRSSLRQPFKPLVSKLLLYANFLVFGYGISLVWQNAALMQKYIVGFAGGADFIGVLHRIGSLTGDDVLKGQWWRLLTTCFVHAGVLHLGMNMFMLYKLGAFVERTWGRWRFFVIYALAGWGGSCLAVAYTPQLFLVGASGALCGIFGAQAVWVLLYGRYLPRSMARRGLAQTLFNILLLVGISLLPGVSGYAHLGGGLAGAAAALVLHLQRFGLPAVPALRWAALVLLVPIAWGSFALVERARANSPAWRKVAARGAIEREREEEEERRRQEKEERERKAREAKALAKKQEAEEEKEREEFEKRFLTEGSDTYFTGIMKNALATYDKQVHPLVQMHTDRRDSDEVKKALADIPPYRRRLAHLAGALDKSGPYQGEVAKAARTTGRDYARALEELLALSERCLRERNKFLHKDDLALEKQGQKVEDLRRRWRDLLKPK